VSSLRGATFLELLILAASYYHAGERIDLMVVETLPDEFDYGDPRQEIGDLLAEGGNAGYLKDFLSRNEGLEFARDTTTGMAVPRESSGAGDTLARRKWVVAFQEKLDGIASRWQLFHYRTRARAAVGYELVRLRAVLFNPWVDAAVPMCEDEFQYNSQALELLIRLAKEHHTQVVIYQAPVLGHKGVETDTFDVAPEDVEHTGAALREVCEKYAVQCLDYRALLSAQLWGDRPGGPAGKGESEEPMDAAHLSGAGQAFLAGQLFKDIRPDIEAAGHPASAMGQ
jgi:hypothetical protein